MYERIQNKQTDAYNKYMQKHKDDIGFKNKRNQSNIESYHKCKDKLNYNKKLCSICMTIIYIF